MQRLGRATFPGNRKSLDQVRSFQIARAELFRKIVALPDQGFRGRLQLRQLRTQVMQDDLFGNIQTIVREHREDGNSLICTTRTIRDRARELIDDFASLYCHQVTHDFVELELREVLGATQWPTPDRFPSMQTFANISGRRLPFENIPSTRFIPKYFEQAIGSAQVHGYGVVPRIAQKRWENTYWWFDDIQPTVLGALLRICIERQIEFRFLARLVTIDLHAAAIGRITENWSTFLCSRRVRDGLETITKRMELPLCWLKLPTCPRAGMEGFHPDLIAFRDHNYHQQDFLICLPSDHPNTAEITGEILGREDVFDLNQELVRSQHQHRRKHRNRELLDSSDAHRYIA